MNQSLLTQTVFLGDEKRFVIMITQYIVLMKEKYLVPIQLLQKTMKSFGISLDGHIQMHEQIYTLTSFFQKKHNILKEMLQYYHPMIVTKIITIELR